MRVKICGITRVEDALCAERAGADAVGLNFVKSSKRYISLEQAQVISQSLGPFLARVGIFLNHDLAEVQEVARVLRLSAVQLHGSEDEAFAETLRSNYTVIKVVSFKPDLSLEALGAFPADAIMLDGLKPGSGEQFDWSEAAFLRGFPKLILAGGLNPDNVAAGIRALRPYAVDVASGVEKAAGLKDADKVNAFISRAKMTLAEGL
jgi:phosphoribosylanthranilate isomerase